MVQRRKSGLDALRMSEGSVDCYGIMAGKFIFKNAFLVIRPTVK